MIIDWVRFYDQHMLIPLYTITCMLYKSIYTCLFKVCFEKFQLNMYFKPVLYEPGYVTIKNESALYQLATKKKLTLFKWKTTNTYITSVCHVIDENEITKYR